MILVIDCVILVIDCVILVKDRMISVIGFVISGFPAIGFVIHATSWSWLQNKMESLLGDSGKIGKRVGSG